MLTANHPWPTCDSMQALFKIGCGQTPPYPAGLSDDGRAFLDLCLAPVGERPSVESLAMHRWLVTRSEDLSAGLTADY